MSKWIKLQMQTVLETFKDISVSYKLYLEKKKKEM